MTEFSSLSFRCYISPGGYWGSNQSVSNRIWTWLWFSMQITCKFGGMHYPASNSLKNNSQLCTLNICASCCVLYHTGTWRMGLCAPSPGGNIFCKTICIEIFSKFLLPGHAFNFQHLSTNCVLPSSPWVQSYIIFELQMNTSIQTRLFCLLLFFFFNPLSSTWNLGLDFFFLSENMTRYPEYSSIFHLDRRWKAQTCSSLSAFLVQLYKSNLRRNNEQVHLSQPQLLTSKLENEALTSRLWSCFYYTHVNSAFKKLSVSCVKNCTTIAIPNLRLTDIFKIFISLLAKNSPEKK